ncbi:MAG: type II secretion system F family protein [Verrucomicrobiota bacterium]|nr:type II secretion system F family protein [Verrucomicrobiota bacterium]
MNNDELAFVNRQLAGMLKAGIPMEVGLKKITKSMTGSKLKAQLDELGSRLEKGQLVDKAVVDLDLPETYKRLLALGQASQSMPKVLICVADYYERIGTLATRLRGLAVYPMLILVCGLIVSGLMAYLSVILKDDLVSISQTDGGGYAGHHQIFDVYGSVWVSVFPMCVFAVGLGLYAFILRSQKMRKYFSWKIPMLRDAALAQYASLTEVLLNSGAPLPEVMGMVSKLENGSEMEGDLKKIEQRLSEGKASYEAASSGCKTIPGFFNWIVSQAGEDVVTGFGHARSIYSGRAENKMQAFLHCFLPVNILLMGILLLVFCLPHLAILMDLMRMVDQFGM